MINEIGSLVETYQRWLREKTQLRTINSWVEITTPYMDRHNDFMQIYAKKVGEHFELTDDGYVISDLEMSGCKIDSPKRQEILRTTLRGLGVELRGKGLVVEARPETFPQKKHALVQAMLAVNDMFFMAKDIVTSLFYEDVVTWLDAKDIRYTEKIKLTGKSGFDHQFDFVISKSKNQPDRFVQLINRPDKDHAMAVSFSWLDTKEVRKGEPKAFAMLNNSEKEVQGNVLSALKQYGLIPILWSERDKSLQQLAG